MGDGSRCHYCREVSCVCNPDPPPEIVGEAERIARLYVHGHHEVHGLGMALLQFSKTRAESAEATIREQAERIKELERQAMSDNPTPTLAELLEWSKTHVMTDEEKEAQRQSWARGEAAMNEGAVIFRPLPQPPTPRISEEEIQRVARYAHEPECNAWERTPERMKAIVVMHKKCTCGYPGWFAAILRTLNETRK